VIDTVTEAVGAAGIGQAGAGAAIGTGGAEGITMGMTGGRRGFGTKPRDFIKSSNWQAGRRREGDEKAVKEEEGKGEPAT